MFFAGLCWFVNVLTAKNTKADLAAKSAFDYLESLPVPTAEALYTCAVTQLGVIRSGRSQRAAALPRDAYCRFLLSVVASDREALAHAPVLLAKAQGDGHNNMAALLEVLRILSVLENGSQDATALPVAIPRVDCAHTDFVNEHSCQEILRAAQAWTGRSGPLPGQAAIDSRDWHTASVQLTQLVQQSVTPASLADLLSPKLDLTPIYARLGYAEFMDGNLEAAVNALNRGISGMQANSTPPDPSSLFLRARIRSILGLRDESLADLEAAAPNDPVAQGVLFLRQGRLKEAAAAFDRAPAGSPDLAAWKYLAQGCSAPLDQLTSAAQAASPLFPKQDATNMVVDCRLLSATTLDQLIALDEPLKLAAPDRAARERISNAYLKYGLDAEDHQNNAVAEKAYLKSIEWFSLNTKARFNLAAIYIGDRKFDQAETQYRALLEADSADRESEFWLAQCILGSAPTPARKSEACHLLEQAQQINDLNRRAQFAQVATTTCSR
jgi:tetratricopeptide (TPR) repeat protein